MAASPEWARTPLSLEFGNLYLIKGTAEALATVASSPPKFIHLAGNGIVYEQQLIVHGDPYQKHTFAAHHKTFKTLPQPASGICLCLFVCDINGDQSDSDKSFVKKNTCDTVQFADLNAYFYQMVEHEPVKRLLNLYDEEARAEMVYLSRFPRRFRDQLRRDRFETPPISLENVNPHQLEESRICQQLCDALLKPNPGPVWRDLTRQEQFFVFRKQPSLMEIFLCGRGRFYPRGIALWYCLKQFLDRYPIDEAIDLFLAWFRLSERQSYHSDGLFRTDRGFYYFKPSTRALRALHALGQTVPFI